MASAPEADDLSRLSYGWVLEKGTPILYVEWRQQRMAQDEDGNAILDENGRNSLTAAAPEWEGRERTEAVTWGSGVYIDHVAEPRTRTSLGASR